jgi:hypothetical protein
MAEDKIEVRVLTDTEINLWEHLHHLGDHQVLRTSTAA